MAESKEAEKPATATGAEPSKSQTSGNRFNDDQYPFETLVANSDTLLGVPGHVLAGVVHFKQLDTTRYYSVSEMKKYIGEFMALEAK